MKKRLLALLLAAILLLGIPMPGAFADARFSQEQELLDFFAAQKKAGAADFEFTCEKGLYDRLLADNAALLSRLQIQGGIESARVFCSAESCLIRMSELRYTDAPWALCASEREACLAMRQLLADLPPVSTLLCTPELAQSLASSGNLLNYAAQAGCGDLNLSFFNNGVIQITNPQPLDGPYAVAEDAAQFDAAIDAFAAADEGSFYIVFHPDFYHRLVQDEEQRTILHDASMLNRFAYQSEEIPGVLRYYSVSYTQDPCLICRSEDDVAKGIGRMGALDVPSFRFYLADEGLRETLIDIPLGYIHPMESFAGLRGASIAHNNNTIFYGAPLMFEIKNPVPVLETAGDALALLEEKAAAGESAITLFCSPELYEALVGAESLLPVPREGMEPLYTLLAQAGIGEYELFTDRITSSVNILVHRYTDGYAIYRALQDDTVGELSARWREALTAAQALAENCRREDAEETLEALRAALEERVAYLDDDGNEEDDSALGALLNGEANDAGLADAFYLLCHLAEISPAQLWENPQPAAEAPAEGDAETQQP